MADRLAEIEARADALAGMAAWKPEDAAVIVAASIDLRALLAAVKAARDVDTRCLDPFRRGGAWQRCGLCSTCCLDAALANLEGDATPTTPGECRTLGGHDGQPCSRCGWMRPRPPAIPAATLERERERHRWKGGA